jgi:hypothetical protein
MVVSPGNAGTACAVIALRLKKRIRHGIVSSIMGDTMQAMTAKE